jgi:hypothetical protein
MKQMSLLNLHQKSTPGHIKHDLYPLNSNHITLISQR